MAVAPLATKADVLAIYDATYLASCFTGNVTDDARLDGALQRATEELYTYLGGRIELPSPVPSLVVRHVVNWAIYDLSATADTMTEHKRRLRDDAVAWAKEARRNERTEGAQTGSDGAVPAPVSAYVIGGRASETAQERRDGLDELM